jgi:hypothetical protein
MMSHGKSSMVLILVVIAALFSPTVALHPAYGNDLIQACAERSGDVHLIGEEFQRQECRPREVLVEWLSGLDLEDQLADLESRVETLENNAATKDEVMDLADRVTALEGRVDALEQAAHGLALYDGNGIKMGDVIDFPDGFTAVTLFNVQDVKFILRVLGPVTGIPYQAVDSSSVSCCLYKENDCSGTPFMQAPRLGSALQAFILPVARVGGPGNTVYLITDPNAIAEQFEPQSQLERDGTCTPRSGGGQQQLFAAQALVSLDTLFIQPFRVLLMP